jgi:hypothetical protein
MFFYENRCQSDWQRSSFNPTEESGMNEQKTNLRSRGVSMLATDGIAQLRQAIEATRRRLVQHSVYQMIDSTEALSIFMERHVFAVWDFMSLLKSLQNSQTCVGVPWLPTPNRAVARFINEIVCGEESDEDGAGGYISHFDLYREAMTECGASTVSLDVMIDFLRKGHDLP